MSINVDETYDIIVIGGGISGLSYAYKSGLTGKKVLLLEKNASLGGAIKTISFPKAKGFWLELGAHTIYNSYSFTLDLIEELDISDQIIPRKKLPFKLFKNDKPQSILTSLNLTRMGLGILLLKFLAKTNKTVKGYYSQIFGHKNYTKVLQYCFNAVLAQKADDFPAELLFKSYSKNKNYPRSFTFKNGLKTIVDALSLSNSFKIVTHAEVTTIEQLNETWLITTNSREYKTAKLVLALPHHVSANLLQNTSFSDISIKLNNVRVSYVTSVAVVLNKTKFKNFPELAGLIGINKAFYSIVFRDVVDNENYRGFVAHFKTDPDRFAKEDDYLQYIKKCLNIPGEAIVDYTCISNNLPILTNSYKQISKLIHEKTKGKNLLLVGNYFSRFALEDCIRNSLNNL